MNVRFKLPHTLTSTNRYFYELESEDLVLAMDEKSFTMRNHYNTKLLGLVPAYLMEITDDPTDTPAINLFTRLSNL